MKNAAIIIVCILYSTILFCQEKSGVNFGRVSVEDFSISKLNVDTTQGAVIIADIGSTYFEGNSKGWFSLIYKHKRRIKIISKKGYELATVEIPLYISSSLQSEETLESLKATTYNLENGLVLETNLAKDAIFKEKQDKNHLLKKFTMPAVKEGSIIEYSYTVKSDFLFNLQPWGFQGTYPCIWSEYELDLPDFFEYVFLTQGYLPFDIKTSKTSFKNYRVNNGAVLSSEKSDAMSIPSGNITSRWVIKNVPALKEERFTTSLSNHISKIEFQMSGQKFPNSMRVDIMGNWEKLSEDLLKDSDFGEMLYRNNGWLNDSIKIIQTSSTNSLDEAKKIYAYVKNNIKCKGIRNIYLSAPLKEIFKNKVGYTADVNLLLVAMLRHQNIQADPVILSTRINGFTHNFYPLINRYNYVICKADINGVTYYLDASKPWLGFNKLPQNCLNGQARVIDKTNHPVYFTADSIVESKNTGIFLYNDDKIAGKWNGTVNSGMGYYESCNARNNILANGKDEFNKKLKETFTGDYAIDSIKFENEKEHELPIKLSYNLNVSIPQNSNIIYFNPMLKEGYTENLFTAAERKYPIEMPFKQDQSYVLHMEIPEGFVVDEMPKSAKIALNEDEGSFEYLIQKTDKAIDLHSRIRLNKANFLPEDYEYLRGFFDFVVKKHAEQIVFKKK